MSHSRLSRAHVSRLPRVHAPTDQVRRKSVVAARPSCGLHGVSWDDGGLGHNLQADERARLRRHPQ
jgi:hypothetical protein